MGPSVAISSVLAIFLATLTGCATFLGDHRQVVRVTSEPPGALLYLNGIPAGKTPTYIQRSHMLSAHVLTLRAPGYDEEVFELPRRFQRVTLWNLINVFGWAIDLVTGNIYRFESYKVHFDLDEVGQGGDTP